MRVLHTESSMNWGGQEMRILEEVRWLDEHGHYGMLACDPRSEICHRATQQGVRVAPVVMHQGLKWTASIRIARLCERERIDIIHTHSPRDSWICYPLHVLGRRVVRSRHFSVPKNAGLSRTFIYRFGCSGVIATSNAILKDLRERYRVPAAKSVCVGEGVDLGMFNRNQEMRAAQALLGVSERTPVIGFVGMIRPEKGTLVFLQAAEKVLETHPEVRFVVAGKGTGNGEYEGRCRAECARITARTGSESILMVGYQADVVSVLAGLTVLVVPSLSEGQSRVIPEAFAMGVPVVASETGGIPELVRSGENGLLVRPGDAGALAQGIRRLIEDQALRERLSRNAFAMASAGLSFDSKMVETLAVYDAIGAGGEICSEIESGGCGVERVRVESAGLRPFE